MPENVEPKIKNMYYKSFTSFRNKISKLEQFSIMQINIRGINDYTKFEKFKVKKEIIVIKHETFSSSFDKIRLDICQNKQKMKILGYYRPPESQKIKNIDEFIDDVEEELMDSTGRIILVGDINIDISENTKHTIKYKNLIHGYDMQIINNNITRDISEKIIDHVTVNFYDSCHIAVHTK